MKNLPKSLFSIHRGASTSNSNTIGSAGGRSFSAEERAQIDLLIRFLKEPPIRPAAVLQLYKIYRLNKEWGSRELALLLWNSKETIFALLAELMLVYRLLSPTRLTMEASTRACNALALLQCIASHPDAKIGFIKAQIPVYVCPFLNTIEQQLLPFEYLRLHSLGVIGALVKDAPNATEIVHFLLKNEILPLCLRCMDVGGERTKSVATLVLDKILEQEEGKMYCASLPSPERFIAVTQSLSKIVNEFSGKPPSALLKNVLNCYLHLSKFSRCREATARCYPPRLTDPLYLDYVCDEWSRNLADEVLRNLIR